MASRSSQLSLGRKDDRHLIQNPNHQVPIPVAPPPFYTTATGQPAPLHVPLSEPSRPRDPFLPRSELGTRRRSVEYQGSEVVGGSVNASRNGTYTAWGAGTGSIPGSGPAPPHIAESHSTHNYPSYPSVAPSAAGAFANGAGVMYTHDPARRRSLGAAGSPRGPVLGGGLAPHVQHLGSTDILDPPSDRPTPPSTQGSRVMLPPSSPQYHTATPFSPQRPAVSHYHSGRDLPGLGTLRGLTNNGMSISSIISGGGNSTFEPTRRSPVQSTTSSPHTKATQPTSPPQAAYPSSRPTHTSWRRADSPDRFPRHNGTHSEVRSSYATDSPNAHAMKSNSNEAVHPSTSLHRYSSSNVERSQYPADDDFHGRLDPWVNTNRSVPQRPNSQPAGGISAQPPPVRFLEEPPRYHGTYHNQPVAESNVLMQEGQARLRSGSDPRTVDQSRGFATQTAPGTTYTPSFIQQEGASHYSPTRQHKTQPNSPLNPRRQAEDPRQQYSGQEERDSASLNAARSGHAVETPATTTYNQHRRPISYEARQPQADEQYQGIDHSYQSRQSNAVERPPPGDYPPPGSDNQQRPFPHDPAPSKIGEELQQQRTYLNVSPETFRLRSLGRASPLPQAVKGASAEYKGPGGAPGIKNEFGRMFSGLGSGLGGTNNGVTTPSRGSPHPLERVDTGESRMSGLDSLEMVRSGSRGLKRTKRWKDEDVDSADRAGTPSGAKRAKTSYNSVHHHHPHMVHHHHHHKPDDEQAREGTPGLPANRLNASLNSSVAYSGTAQVPHHHHHYPLHNHAHQYHYHAHVPKASTPLVPPPPPQRTTITSSNAVLQSVVNRPRKHLGSKLYTVKYDLPARTVPSLLQGNALGLLGTLDKFGYTMTPEPIPEFTEATSANCTFTVRIPRIYLTNEKLEEITRHRFLWGSEVYTDDSCPIAAAIHAGWIRGAWSAEVDEKLLGMPNPSKKATPTVMTLPLSSGPVLPPSDKDAHITLLLLPRLESYAASTKNGLKSRNWGGNHDGLSFMIHKIEWLEDGIWGGSWGQERGPAARKQRLREKAAQRRKAMEWIEKLESNKNGSKSSSSFAARLGVQDGNGRLCEAAA